MVRAILGSRHTFPGCLPERPQVRPSVLSCGPANGGGSGPLWCVVWCGVMHSSFIYWQGRTTGPTGCSNASLMTGCCHNFSRVSRKIISKIVWVNNIISLSTLKSDQIKRFIETREDSFASSNWKLPTCLLGDGRFMLRRLKHLLTVKIIQCE